MIVSSPATEESGSGSMAIGEDGNGGVDKCVEFKIYFLVRLRSVGN